MKFCCWIVIRYNSMEPWFCFRSAASRAWGHGHAAQRPQRTAALPEPPSGPVEPLQVLQCRAETWQAGRTLQTGQHSTGTHRPLDYGPFFFIALKKLKERSHIKPFARLSTHFLQSRRLSIDTSVWENAMSILHSTISACAHSPACSPPSGQIRYGALVKMVVASLFLIFLSSSFLLPLFRPVPSSPVPWPPPLSLPPRHPLAALTASVRVWDHYPSSLSSLGREDPLKVELKSLPGG